MTKDVVCNPNKGECFKEEALVERRKGLVAHRIAVPQPTLSAICATYLMWGISVQPVLTDYAFI